jgi:hypothetical protein
MRVLLLWLVRIDRRYKFYFTPGIDCRFTPEFALQGTLNYQVDRANADNGNVRCVDDGVRITGDAS